MERREKWATYYAGNSAALAHYHLALSKNSSGGVEPYVRPQSPPMPPQMEQNQVVMNQVQVAAVSQPNPVVTTTVGGPVSMTLDTPKKKSRWANNTSQQQQQQQQGDTSYYGPSAGKSMNNNNISSLTNLEAAAVQNRGGNKTSELYSKFAPASSSSQVGMMAGTKRKQMMSQFNDDEEDSSDVPNYYGPSSTTTVNSNKTSFITSKKNSYEDDYVPLGMDQPLGSSSTTTPSKLSKKERKRQKKLALAAKQQASFDSSSATSMSGFDINETALSERANRFKGKGGIHSASSTPSSLKGGVDKYMGKTTIGGSMKKLNENDYERMTVKGTCTKLEKEYLRLTSPPKSELVRPQYILQQHLTNLKQSYYENNKVHNGRQRDYNWYCSQFKAIRQDLTVQRIINAFAVNVYESHAKIALEEDDINEYNQSQTQLKELYETIERNANNNANGGVKGGGLGGKMQKGKKRQGKNKKDDYDGEDGLKNRNEFIAYRIIYYVFLSGNRKYEGGSSDIFKVCLIKFKSVKCVKLAAIFSLAFVCLTFTIY